MAALAACRPSRASALFQQIKLAFPGGHQGTFMMNEARITPPGPPQQPPIASPSASQSGSNEQVGALVPSDGDEHRSSLLVLPF
jgi:hypothetical protein